MREVFYKFFRGVATFQEEVEVKKWIEKSLENETFFYNERLLYDAVLLNKEIHQNKSIRARSIKIVFYNYFMRVAAVFLLLTTVGLLINKHIEEKNSTYKFHTVNVPLGQRINLILEDNSSIWLSSNTTFKYPSKFSKNLREVYLDGEAYLTIASNEKRPFIVHVGEHQIEVLGTEFLVSACSQDDLIEVDLISGKVNVNVARSTDNSTWDSYRLEPKQSLKVNKNTRDVQKQYIQDDFYAFWKEGEYLFKKQSFRSLANKLERIYNVAIVFEDKSLESSMFTGALYSNSTMNATLESFKKTSSIPFTYNKKNEIIFIKKQSK